MSRAIPFNTPVVIHDGQGHYRGGLVFASRTDIGDADDFAPVTVVTLSPKFEPAGAARGNVTDAVEVLHDVPYVEEEGKFGYSDGVFDGEEPLTIKPKPVVLAMPVPVVMPEPVTDSTGELTPEGQAEPARLAIVGGVPVAVRELQPGIETPHEAPVVETRVYADGSSVTGMTPLPDHSPEEQEKAANEPTAEPSANPSQPMPTDSSAGQPSASEENPVANTQESVETPIEPPAAPEPAAGEEGHPV